jgi:hypothetical protein
LEVDEEYRTQRQQNLGDARPSLSAAVVTRNPWNCSPTRDAFRRIDRTRHEFASWIVCARLSRFAERGDPIDAAHKQHALFVAVEGGKLTITGSGKNLMVMDEKGNTANVTIADVMQSNGVIMVVNKVLMPN